MNTPSTLLRINGVPLLTKSGAPKSRYSADERLQILGGSKADLEAFINLFCPDRPLYAATRGSTEDPRDWMTPRGRLDASHVIKHLVGNLTPGIHPKWIAPKSWEVTQWIGIDVDYRGNKADFEKRKHYVIGRLKRLGIPRRGILVSVTPSGGRHYRFFLKQKIKVGEIPIELAKVGLVEKPGQIEIFPRQSKGMRLPFGYIPGEAHDPTQWRKFIRNFRRGTIPDVCWYELLQRISRIEKKRFDRRIARSSWEAQPIKKRLVNTEEVRQSIRPRPFANMVQPREVVSGIGCGSDSKVQTYEQLLARNVATPEDVKQLMNLGIQKAGTRVEVTKRIAFHMLVVMREPPNLVKEYLTKWVYRTGQHTSVDVMDDIKKGRRTVERQIAGFVDWIVKNHENKHTSLKSPNPSGAKQHVNDDELHIIREHLKKVPPLPFLETTALSFLKFAKLHGRATPEGWIAEVAIRGVVRKWPGCARMQYKPLLDALQACELVSMIREKKQSSNGTGRPRTYLLRIAPALATCSTKKAAQEVAEAKTCDPAPATSSDVESIATSSTENLDTYRKSISSSPNEVGNKIEEAPQEKLKVAVTKRLASKFSHLQRHCDIFELHAPDCKLKQKLSSLINDNHLNAENAKSLSFETYVSVLPEPVPDLNRDRLARSPPQSNEFLSYRSKGKALGKCDRYV